MMLRALNVDKLRLDTGEYVLSVQRMTKRAGARELLSCVDLDVKRGTYTALIGPPGAGKTLALACIAGALRPTSGRVRYFGYEIKGRAQERVARMGIVRTHQTPRPFGEMSVLETVTVGALLRRPAVGRARAFAGEIVASVGLGDRAALRFAELDERERRRLELARALATEPHVLLLDDLAGESDAMECAALGAIVDGVRARGVTIVAVARTLERIPSVADHIVEIDRGKTAETGAHAAINVRT